MTLAEVGVVVAIILSVLGAVAGIFNYFKKPQEDIEKKQAITDHEVESKAHILAEQLKWEKESNDRRFDELSKSLAAVIALNQNHTHTIDVKVDNLTTSIHQMNLSMSCELAKLTAILNERIPVK